MIAFSIWYFDIVADRVFDDTTVTVDVFEDICKPIVDSALAGFNGNS